MIEVKVDAGDLQRTVTELAATNRKIRTGVRQAVSRHALNIQADARMRVPVATNRLRSSIRTRFTVDRLGAVISTNTDYAVDVEYGTKPHIVPIENLIDWVRIKIISNIKAASSIAKAIQWKISQEGTKPQPYMTPAFEKYKPRFIEDIRQVIKRS